MPSQTDLKIINAALRRSGGNSTITSLADNSPEAEFASTQYELIVEDCLTHPWNFSRRVFTLNLLDPDVHGEPPAPWLSEYQMPSDLLYLRALVIDGFENLKYQVFGRSVLTNYGSDYTVNAIYTYRVSEEEWPGWFSEWVVRRLTAEMFRGINSDSASAADTDKLAVVKFNQGTVLDAQSQSPVNMLLSDVLTRRRSGGVGSTRG